MRSLWFGEALLAEGWARDVRITIRDGYIFQIVRNVPPNVADTVCGIALPGLCNVHSHAFQRGMAGLAERVGPSHDDFWTWREVMYQFLDRLTPNDIEAISAMAFAEMLEAGFTRVGEFHYMHKDERGAAYGNTGELMDSIIAAAQSAGIALTLLPVFYAHGGFGGAPPTHRQRRFITSVEEFGKLVDYARTATQRLPASRTGIAPHSLRAVTPEELAAILPLARNDPIHIHVAEQIREVSDCVGWSGRRPVRWLLNHAPVDDRWCLIHATHLDSDEVKGLAQSNAVAGLCPLTEANLGDGIFPAKQYLRDGGRIGIGTDSNIAINAAQELRMIEYTQRLNSKARNVLGEEEGASVGKALFAAALAGGAQALGASSPTLTVGAPADIVVLDAAHPSLVGRHGDTILDSLVFANTKCLIRSVWVHGELAVNDGYHLRRFAIVARYRKAIERLLA